MATTVGQHSVAAFTSPVNGTSPIDANSVRGNDNTMRSAYVDHDADTGIHVQSSTLASRPSAGVAGRKWITEDSGIYTLWFDDGVHWHPVSSEAVAITVLATENLVKGDVVKVVGWNNGQDLAEVAKTTSASDVAFAVITAAVSSGVLGYATNTGVLQDINTNAYAVGTVLYPNASGGFTSTKPTSGNYQPVAYVLRQNTNNGVIYVEFSAPRIVERSDNTASTIVLRDASGNFSAGTITFAGLKGTGATTVTDILNDGTMATASATTLATSSSIKTYVDSQVATVDTLAEVLANGNTTGATDIIVNAGQKIRTPAVAAQDGTAALTIANTTGTVTAAGTLNATTLGGTLSTAAQPNVTSVGTLTSLTVSGDITASAGSSTDPSITFSGYTNWGFGIDGTGLRMVAGGAGTTTTFTTTGLTTNNAVVSGDLTVDTSTLKVDSANNRVGIGTATPSTTLEVVGSSGAANIRDTQAYSFGTSGGKLFFQGLDNLGGLTTFAYLHASPANGNQDRGFLDIFTRVDGVATKTLEIGTGLSGNVSVPNGNFIVDTNTLYVDAANNRVGMGTASPGVALDVVNSALGIVRVRGGGGTNEGGAFFISNSAGSSTLAAFGDYARIGGGATDASVSIYTNASIPLRFDVGGTEKMRLDSNGNLGIGVTSPAVRLHAQSDLGGVSESLRLQNDSTFATIGRGTQITFRGTSGGLLASITGETSTTADNQGFLTYSANGASGFHKFLTNSVERARIDASGNLGIGTSSPAALLHLKAPTNPVIQFEEASGSGFIDYNATRLQLHGGGGSMYFVTGNAERMRLDVSGNLGINCTADSKLRVLGATAGTGPASLRIGFADTSVNYFDADTQYFRKGDSTNTMTIDANGRLGIGTTSPGYLLDVRGSSPDIVAFHNGANGSRVGITATNTAAYISTTYSTNDIPLIFTRGGIGSSGSELMRLDTSGRLGIGTTGPGYSLDVVGFGRFSSGVIGSAGLTMYGDASSASGMFLSTGGNLGIGVTPSVRLEAYAPTYGGVVARLIDNSGVGGGRGAILALGGTSNDTGAVQSNFGSVAGFKSNGTQGNQQGYLSFATNSGSGTVERAIIDSSGNLGLGVTPSAWGGGGKAFEVGALGNGLQGRNTQFMTLTQNAYYDALAQYIYGSNGLASRYDQDAGAHKWFTAASGTAGNAITFTQAMTLDASGDLLVGTTSAYRSGRLVVKDVNCTQTSTVANLHVSTTDTQAANLGGSIGLGGQVGGDEAPFGYISGRKENSTSGNYAGYLAFATPDSGGTVAERARIDSSGNLGVGATTVSSTLGRNITINGTNAGTNSGIVLQSSAVERGYVYASDTQMVAGSSTSIPLLLLTGGSEAVRITSGGDVGIGKTNPGSVLDVEGEIRASSGADNVQLGATGTNVYLAASGTQGMSLETNGSTRIQLSSTGNVVAGTGAVATNATNGFLYVPTCAGTPTGTPTAYGGRAPIVIDTTNNKLYFYSGGAWRDAGP